MNHINLINGGLALIDDEDYEYLSQWIWRKDPQGYAKRTSRLPSDVSRHMHRIVNQTPQGLVTDHINGNKLDNRKENLRSCSVRQNVWNKHKPPQQNGLRGISLHSEIGRWRVYISHEGKQKWLGWFDELADAISAYNLAATQLRGEFALLNTHTTDQVAEIQSMKNEMRRGIVQSTPLLKSNKTGYQGVATSRKEGRYRVHCRGAYFGCFTDVKEAAYVYDQVAMQLIGEDCRTNFEY